MWFNTSVVKGVPMNPKENFMHIDDTKKQNKTKTKQNKKQKT